MLKESPNSLHFVSRALLINSGNRPLERRPSLPTAEFRNPHFRLYFRVIYLDVQEPRLPVVSKVLLPVFPKDLGPFCLLIGLLLCYLASPEPLSRVPILSPIPFSRQAVGLYAGEMAARRGASEGHECRQLSLLALV